MKRKKEIIELSADHLESINGGSNTLGAYRPGFRYRQKSLQFFKECVGEAVYSRAMNSDAGRVHHYTVARAFLSQKDWEKFVWIEEFGSLDGFLEQ